jgi:hypothetical protein
MHLCREFVLQQDAPCIINPLNEADWNSEALGDFFAGDSTPSEPAYLARVTPLNAISGQSEIPPNDPGLHPQLGSNIADRDFLQIEVSRPLATPQQCPALW